MFCCTLVVQVTAFANNIAGYAEGAYTTAELLNAKHEESSVGLESVIKEQQARITELTTEVEKLREKNEDLDAAVSARFNAGEFVVTAYSPYDNVSGMENNGNPDATSTGVRPSRGTIAVDPKVIPYGSKVLVVYDDGSTYVGRAEDCGGLIKNNIIDVYKDTYAETVEHGRKKALVYWFK